MKIRKGVKPILVFTNLQPATGNQQLDADFPPGGRMLVSLEMIRRKR